MISSVDDFTILMLHRVRIGTTGLAGAATPGTAFRLLFSP